MHAIVTGHSRGLGAAIAEEFLARGIPVLGLARSTNAALAQRFPDLLQQVILDLSDQESLVNWLTGRALSDFLAESEEGILINNAGLLEPTGSLGELNTADIVRAVQLNLSAPLLLSNAAASFASDTRKVRLVHISSGAARNAYAGWGVYCATKAALDQHARTVLLEGRPWVKVCSIAPGVVDTDMQTQVRSLDVGKFPARERFIALKAEDRLWSARQAAERMVSYVLSDHFGYEATADLRDL